MRGFGAILLGWGLLLILTALFIVGFISFGSISQANAAGHKTKINAVYKIYLNGLKLGKFHFKSSLSSGKYSLFGKGKVDFLKGIFFEWKGTTRSEGKLTSQGPEPASYFYRSKYNKKVEKLKMKFDDNMVSKVVPPLKRSKRRVPITERDLTGVFDPMSALMLITKPHGPRTSGQSVCSGTIPVFDGEQRFDLKLSYKKTAKVRGRKAKGYSKRAYVCRVKYIPVAGHKPNKYQTKFMAETNGIEIWLVPIPKAGMFMPYHVSLPLPVGSASATSSVFQIDSPHHGRIAFVR